MPEILAMLDVAIAEVGQKVRASSRSSRREDAPQANAGTGKRLKSKAVPALPVVPVNNDAIHDGTERIEKTRLRQRATPAVSRT